jgi:hypothetical protein
MSSGSMFHNLGVHTAKARSPMRQTKTIGTHFNVIACHICRNWMRQAKAIGTHFNVIACHVIVSAASFPIKTCVTLCISLLVYLRFITGMFFL